MWIPRKIPTGVPLPGNDFLGPGCNDKRAGAGYRWRVRAPTKINRSPRCRGTTAADKWQIARKARSLHNRGVWQHDEHVTEAAGLYLISTNMPLQCVRLSYYSILRNWPARIDRSPCIPDGSPLWAFPANYVPSLSTLRPQIGFCIPGNLPQPYQRNNPHECCKQVQQQGLSFWQIFRAIRAPELCDRSSWVETTNTNNKLNAEQLCNPLRKRRSTLSVRWFFRRNNWKLNALLRSRQSVCSEPYITRSL